jgi:hypothetical protein
MKCPHCLVTFDDDWETREVTRDREVNWYVRNTTCSACKQAILVLKGDHRQTGHRVEIQTWPKGSARPVAPEVPEPYAGDFREACTVLPDSTNASAAISRRCLQSLLVNEGGAKKGRLVDQIEEVVDSKQLRTQLAENLHYVRKVGNLGAHETKNDHTGEVVDATREEAEWLIEVLEGLFEHFFVEPQREQKRREEFDARIQSAKGTPAASSAEPAPTPEPTVADGAPAGQGQSSQID